MSDRIDAPGACRRAGARVWHRVALGVVLLVSACTENVSEVVVTSVRVEPAYAALPIGRGVQFAAIVVDDAGIPLTGAGVTWSSDAPDVFSVDSRGLGQAHTDGVATIEATFLNVRGSTTVVVLPPPVMELSPGHLSLVRDADGQVLPSTVEVNRTGTGTLGQMDTEIRYPPGEATDWLTAEFEPGMAPATMIVSVDTGSLESGVYDASVRVLSNEPGVTPVDLPVRLTLGGFTISVPDSGVTVTESQTVDAFEVVLDLEPEGDVVLSLAPVPSSAITVKPDNLTFTPANWSTPRTVQVKALDDVELNGDRTASVQVGVHADSDSIYAAVADHFVDIRILDDDVAGLVVTETGNVTLAREGDDPDTFAVSLAARPLTRVIVTISTDDPSDARVTPASLTFMPDDWDIPQTVEFVAVEDDVRDGTRLRIVTAAVQAQGSDVAFHGLSTSFQAITFDRKSSEALR